MKTATSFVLLLISTAALAHGGGEHVMGTVKAVDEKSITIETQDKKDVQVTLDASTKFERDGKPATVKDVAVGDRAVAHTAKKEEGSTELHANLVKLSAKKATP